MPIIAAGRSRRHAARPGWFRSGQTGQFSNADEGITCHMSLLVVGSVALDSVETPTAKRDNVLGGSAVFFSYAASYFTPVRLVGVVGDDWPSEHTALAPAARHRHGRPAGRSAAARRFAGAASTCRT